MIRIIQENLVRQNKALILLHAMLQEEFSRLSERDPQGVSGLEMSIQELLRQIGIERFSLRHKIGMMKPGAQRVHEIMDMLEAETAQEFQGLLDMLDVTEQNCARQAAMNHELANALRDQSKKLLDFMHNEIQPKKNNLYSARGAYARGGNTSPSLLSGRF